MKMKRRPFKKSRRLNGTLIGRLLAAGAAVTGLLFAIRTWPEIHRYLRIKRM